MNYVASYSRIPCYLCMLPWNFWVLQYHISRRNPSKVHWQLGGTFGVHSILEPNGRTRNDLQGKPTSCTSNTEYDICLARLIEEMDWSCIRYPSKAKKLLWSLISPGESSASLSFSRSCWRFLLLLFCQSYVCTSSKLTFSAGCLSVWPTKALSEGSEITSRTKLSPT